VRKRFGDAHQKAADGEYDNLLDSSKDRLALIILIDQFSRQIYRDGPQAFAYDPIALQWCLAGLEKKHDLELHPIERGFFYLPLEHSEEMEHQNRCVQLFTDLMANVSTQQQPVIKAALDFAIKHRQVIEKFGRYPHRNRVLNRPSTSMEAEYLSQPGAGF